MRKLSIHLTVLAIVAAANAVGCEDGPNQTYNPAPASAGNVWNNGNGDAAINPTAQNFDAGYPTSNATSLCSTDFKRRRWSWMLTQPVQPPRFYAGLDMAKDDLWTGLRIEDAENPPSDPTSPTGGLCQSTPFGFQGTCPSGFGGCNLNAFGNNQEVQFIWNVATHLVDQMILNLGYTGTLTTKPYPDHNGESHSYSLQVGDIVRRDGQPYQIAWTDIPTARVQITDIFNAIMSTFSVKAGVPFDTSACMDDSTCNAPGTKSICECQHVIDPTTKKPTAACMAAGQCGIKNCGTDGNCLIRNDGSVTIFGIRPMVIYVQGTAGVPQPALSTPTLFYNFFSKWEPFSYLPQEVKLDQDGPNSTGTPIGAAAATTVCSQQIGQTFDDFRANCVQVHGDMANPNGVDAVNLNKVTHSLTHDQEHWTANVLGVNQNFTSQKVINDPDSVVLDTDTPQPGDLAQDWTFDVRARGAVLNDKGELRGSALVFIEWARLMLADIARIQGLPTPKTLGDPTCVGFDSGGNPNYKKNPGCSGIEGMIIPSNGGIDFTKDPLRKDLDPGANADQFQNYASILKPGDVSGPFCIDPGPETDCTYDTTLSTWGNALLHVTRVMGGGDINKIPSELRDRRYYFKWFGIAFIKYLKAYGNYNPATRNNLPTGVVGGGLGPSDVLAQKIDQESLFFDYLTQPGAGGAQTFDKFEYVDRDFIGKGVGGAFNFIPWDFEYGTDLKGGNQRYDNYFRRMDREEIAMYSAMLEDKTHTPGQENNVNITNLFGSTLLGGDPKSNVAGLWPSYSCAIGQAGDPGAKCGGVNPPLDPTNPSKLPACAPDGTCAVGRNCITGTTYEAGTITKCAVPCNFTTFAKSGCASPSQTCVVNGTTNGCFDMKMDRNGTAANAHPLLWHYPGAWSRTPFSRGHSPITIPAANKHPNLGVAKVVVPNFLSGPYTDSPQLPDSTGMCGTGYAPSTNGIWCNAALNAGTNQAAPTFAALSPWLEVQPGVGFRIPLDGQRDQRVTTGQIDYTGVLESYIVDYVPYVDGAKQSCVADGKCNKGFSCDPVSKSCVTDDDTIAIQAIEGADFLGEAFLCVDPATQDVLHVRMYDSVLPVLDWFAAHPGAANGNVGVIPSAQAACQIVIRRTPADNFIDSITSKSNGVDLNVGGGQGLGRVTDVVLFDPTLVQAL